MLVLSRLRQVREWKLLSQRDLAEMARMSPATIVRLERGGQARFVTVRKLAEALGVPPEDIIGSDADGP